MRSQRDVRLSPLIYSAAAPAFEYNRSQRNVLKMSEAQRCRTAAVFGTSSARSHSLRPRHRPPSQNLTFCAPARGAQAFTHQVSVCKLPGGGVLHGFVCFLISR